MRITRIECEGSEGRFTIERPLGDPFMRIDSIVREPQHDPPTWKTWRLSAHASHDELFDVAGELQYRTEGARGTSFDIADYLRELERFTE
jgi:hypothetical protein